jgi:metaxin
VRASIAAQLQSAASAELLKSSGNGGVIDIKDIYAEAEKAFEALSILLGDGEWFFSGCEDDDGGKGKGVRKGGKGGQAGDEPTVFDAEVFAYTHLLLDWEMGWREKRLVRAVKKWENLVEHRDRVLRRYYEGDLVTVR